MKIIKKIIVSSGSDSTFFRDEKWRFHPNGGLFLNRKLGYLQPSLKEFLVTETQIDSFGQRAISYMMDKNGNVLQKRIDKSEENDKPKAQNQGPFPGLTFLWSLYRRPFTTAVGAYLNRPGSGLNWVPIIKDAPTIPPWPFKYPWDRIPRIPFVPFIG